MYPIYFLILPLDFPIYWLIHQSAGRQQASYSKSKKREKGNETHRDSKENDDKETKFVNLEPDGLSFVEFSLFYTFFRTKSALKRDSVQLLVGSGFEAHVRY